MTPEGRRAPLADLLRATRSVNTQTPATDLPSSSYSSGKEIESYDGDKFYSFGSKIEREKQKRFE